MEGSQIRLPNTEGDSVLIGITGRDEENFWGFARTGKTGDSVIILNYSRRLKK